MHQTNKENCCLFYSLEIVVNCFSCQLFTFNYATLEKNLDLIPYLFYPVVMLIGLPCLMIYGGHFYSVITGRPGFTGRIYEYYHISKWFYGLYCLFIASGAAFFLITPVILLIQGKGKLLGSIYFYFLWFLLFVIISLVGLSYRYEGKG